MYPWRDYHWGGGGRRRLAAGNGSAGERGSYRLKTGVNKDGAPLHGLRLVHVRKQIEDRLVRGQAGGRADGLPNFAAVGEAKPVARDRLDTPADAPLLLALGRLHQVKAIDVLLQALTLETRPYLWIAGDGPLRAELQTLARKLDVAERVRFLG